MRGNLRGGDLLFYLIIPQFDAGDVIEISEIQNFRNQLPGRDQNLTMKPRGEEAGSGSGKGELLNICTRPGNEVAMLHAGMQLVPTSCLWTRFNEDLAYRHSPSRIRVHDSLGLLLTRVGLGDSGALG